METANNPDGDRIVADLPVPPVIMPLPRNLLYAEVNLSPSIWILKFHLSSEGKYQNPIA